MEVRKLPKFLRQYFWDVDFDELDGQKYSLYVVKRLIDKGNQRAIKWLLENYPKELIKQILVTQRGLSPKTANFWALVLGVDKRKVVCLQKPYLNMRQQLWPY